MKIIITIITIVLLISLPCCMSAYAESEIRIFTATDLHYIAPSLTDNGEYYQRVLKNGDSKFMPYIEGITDAFLDEVIKERPAALLLTGDLTFNGAIISHEALAEKLRVVKDTGIPILVQTGNHDLYNVNAAKYQGDTFTRVPYGTTELFSTIYKDYGLDGAVSVDRDSLSYIYPLNDELRILMLDLNTDHDFCGLSEKSLIWVEEQLKNAQAAGTRVLAAGHQNIFQHSIFQGGYVISGADQLASLFRKYNVTLYLSGHLHIQHILEQDGMTEIATSALCSYPCQYGILEFSGDSVCYKTKRLDMAEWARKNGITDPVFQNFQDAAASYMSEHLNSSLPESINDIFWKRKTDYLKELNLAYFSGDLRGLESLDPDGSIAKLWLQPNDMTSMYVGSVLRDQGKNYNVWEGTW